MSAIDPLRTLATSAYLPRMGAAWWITLVILWVITLLEIRRWGCAGVLVLIAGLYAFLQVSSHFFLVPWYKDGGNGAGLDDWWVWLIWAALLAGAAWVSAALTSVLSKAR